MSRRYFLVRIHSDQAFTSEQVSSALEGALERYFGEFGKSRMNTKLIRFDPQDSLLTVACRREASNEVEAAITMISQIGNVQVVPLVLRRSGTLKGLSRIKRRQSFSR